MRKILVGVLLLLSFGVLHQATADASECTKVQKADIPVRIENEQCRVKVLHPEPPTTQPWEKIGLAGAYANCSQLQARNLVVIPGGTSYSSTNGTIKVSQWHIDQGGDVLCWTLAHEDGHMYAFNHGTGAYLGAPPAGYPDNGDPECWANAYATALTGISNRGDCGDVEAAMAFVG